MIKKIAVPLLILLVFLPACIQEPDPIPPAINTYLFFYNFLMEPYDIQWELDDDIMSTGHSYGFPAESMAILEQTEQDVLFRSRDSESGTLIDSLGCLLVENGVYMLAMMGNEEEPYLLFEQIDTRFPSTGMTKVQFLHAAASLGPVDIYIGGDQPEHKVFAGETYTQLSEYLETSEEKLWNAVIVTPAETPPADSTILSYTVNTVFRTGSSYLCIIGHAESSEESTYQIHVNKQSGY